MTLPSTPLLADPIGTWSVNTSPGPRHAATPGPWQVGQGSDRGEWGSFFAASPVNPNFMILCTDLGRAYYTSTALAGVEFRPIDVPLYGASSVAFHPTDGQTAFVLFTESEAPGLGGWWRTTDEGETWSPILITPASRGAKRLFAVDPARPTHLYAGTTTGLMRSTDNGATWATIAFAGQSILTLAMASDGSRLYVIPGNQTWEDPTSANTLTRGGTSLWRMDGGDPASLAQVLDAAPFNCGRFFDLDLHPTDPSRGRLICGDNLLTFESGGTVVTANASLGGNLGYIRYNPANPDHLILVGSGGINWSKAFRWSSNGGASWNSWTNVGGWITALRDHAPCNWTSPDGYLEAVNAKVGFAVETVVARPMVGFVPGNASAVLFWGTSWNKAPWRSNNHGASFEPFAHGGGFKEAVQMDYGQTANRIVVARTEYGLQLTNDGGNTWRAHTVYNTPEFPAQVASGVRAFEARSAWGGAFDPANDNILLATINYAPTRILRSEDFGATWTTVGNFNHSTTGTAYTDGRVLWSRADPAYVYISNLRSSDGGRTFPVTLAHPVAEVHPADAAILLSKENANSWWLSRDYGATWTQLPNPPYASDGLSRAVNDRSHTQVSFDPRPQFNPALGGSIRLLTGGEGGLWEFVASNPDATAGTWSRLQSLDPVPDPYLAGVGKPVWLGAALFNPHPAFAGEVYALAGPPPANKDRGEALYQQIYRSTDYGLTWSHVADPVTCPGDLPNYLFTRAAAFAPSGTFSIQDYSGMYSFVPNRGSLTASMTSQNATTYHLTNLGYADWGVFGYSSSIHQVGKAGATEVGAYTVVGSPAVSVKSYSGSPWDRFSWTDGDNPVSKSNQIRSLGAAGAVGDGLAVTVPAGTTTRRVILWTSGWKADGTLTATLSDGSAPAVVQTITPGGDDYHRTKHVIDYRAGRDGESLRLEFVIARHTDPLVTGNVKFQAIALEPPAVP